MFGIYKVEGKYFIIQNPKYISFEHYYMLKTIGGLPLDGNESNYLAVSLKPLFGQWTSESFEFVRINASKLNRLKMLKAINVFFLNLGKSQHCLSLE